jgi:transposase
VSSEEQFAKFEARLAKLEQENATLRAEVEGLRGENAALRAELVTLKSEQAKADEKANANSTNSNKPPSSDPPGTRPGKTPTGNKRGAQVGHPPHSRQPVDPEKVSKRTLVQPVECRHCGSHALTLTKDAPLVHQVGELPEIEIIWEQFELHTCECRGCGKKTRAELPPGVPRHMFGPRLLAFLAFLVAGRMSRRQVQSLCLHVLGFRASLGAISEAEARTSSALAAPVAEAIAYARKRRIKHVDASSWSLSGQLRALWTIATSAVTVFFVASDQKTETISALMRSLRGFLVTDRGSQFGFWVMERRQICWAHLIRKFVAYSERKDEGAAIGVSLLLISQSMLSAWHQVRDGTLTRGRYQVMAENAQVAMEELLARGVALRLRGLSGSCENILAHKEALFRFAFVRDLEPTNNRAERALRAFVMWRKTSYGSQSERGCAFAQRLMTVVETLRQQKRPVFAFLVDACRAAQRGTPTPSLLPTR